LTSDLKKENSEDFWILFFSKRSSRKFKEERDLKKQKYLKEFR